MNEPEVLWPAPPPAEEYVRIGPARTTFPGDPESAVSRAREQFARYKALHLRNLFDPQFLETLVRLSAATAFGSGELNAPGFREVELSPQRTGRVVSLAVNRPEFLRWLQNVTDCSGLSFFEGRLTQTLNRPGDELLWHDDLPTAENRRLAMVINFSTEPYTGGEFQLRRLNGKPLFEHHHTELGSALIFRVKPGLEHRVLPLASGGPRRVFAGWAFAGKLQ